MNLIINGKAETVEQDTVTVRELLTIKNVDMPDMVSVELNNTILKRDMFDTIRVADGDTVEFLYFMGGGR